LGDVIKCLIDNKDLVQALCALLAVLVGFLSIILTVITIHSNRKHNRLSVKPLLRIDRIISTGSDVAISLLNSGVGPAIIKSINIKVDGTILPQTQDIWDVALNKVVSQKYNVRIYSPSSGNSFSSGESHALYTIPSSELNEQDYPILLDAFQKISFEIIYASIYGEVFKEEL
jgi:hypothetical protein